MSKYKILSDSLFDLQNDLKSRPDYYIDRGGVRLEKDVYEIVNKYAEGTVFSWQRGLFLNSA